MIAIPEGYDVIQNVDEKTIRAARDILDKTLLAFCNSRIIKELLPKITKFEPEAAIYQNTMYESNTSNLSLIITIPTASKEKYKELNGIIFDFEEKYEYDLDISILTEREANKQDLLKSCIKLELNNKESK